MGLMKRSTLAQLFDEEFPSNIGGELVLEHDALAAAWANYRMWLYQPLIRWRPLNTVLPNAEDCAIAGQIRRYYRDRYTVKMLRGLNLTRFQSDVLAVVEQHVDQQLLHEKHLGMLYRLPYLYVEDQARDELGTWYRDHSTPATVEDSSNATTRDMNIKPYLKILRSRRSGEQWEFWWQTDQQQLAMAACQASNELLSLMCSLFDRGDTLCVHVRPCIKTNPHMPGAWYWHLQELQLR